jgi:hypothetical protein
VYGVAFNPYHGSPASRDGPLTPRAKSPLKAGLLPPQPPPPVAAEGDEEESAPMMFATWGVRHVKLWVRHWDEVRTTMRPFGVLRR